MKLIFHTIFLVLGPHDVRLKVLHGNLVKRFPYWRVTKKSSQGMGNSHVLRVRKEKKRSEEDAKTNILSKLFMLRSKKDPGVEIRVTRNEVSPEKSIWYGRV